MVEKVVEPQEARRRPRPLGQRRLALAHSLGADDRLPQALSRLVAAIEHEVLEYREPGKAARHLESSNQPAAADRVRRPASDLLPIETHATYIRPYPAPHHLQQAGFPP